MTKRRWLRAGLLVAPLALLALLASVRGTSHRAASRSQPAFSHGQASGTATGATSDGVVAGVVGRANCIETPSACGYPDATNSGVPAGASLQARAEDMKITTPGATVSDMALYGSIEVEADDTTIRDTEVSAGAGGGGHGGHGIWIAPGVTGTVIEYVTCHGAPVVQYCFSSNNSTTEISHSYAYNCTECMAGPGTLSNSYLDDNGTIEGEHYEDIYYGGGAGPLIVNHNTMLNPHGQTAVVFASVDFGNQTTLTITNNLMAGGGYTIYGGGSGSGGIVTGPVTVTDNRFSRKYYPQGGYYGIAAYFTPQGATWSGNVWDETLRPASRG